MATNAKYLSIVILVIEALWCPLFAQTGKFAGGTGTADDPFRIATAQQLTSVNSGSTMPDMHFVLLNDLDLDPNLPGGRTFEDAVIASKTWFEASFDGRGHTIRNLTIRARSSDGRSGTAERVGLFGWIHSSGVVRNLCIETADVQVVDSRAGILAGDNGGRVIDCQVTGRVSSYPAALEADELGGLVGRNTGDIVNCRADTDLVLGNKIVGGLVGGNFPEGRIVGCRAVCKQLTIYKYNAGGLVGINSGYIIGSSAMGGILAGDSSSSHGGLAGANAGTLLNCLAGSNIAAGARCSGLGGLVGDNQGMIVNCYADGSISTQDRCQMIGSLVGRNGDFPAQFHGCIVNSYAAGKIFLGTNNQSVGGLLGDNTYGEVKMSFWDVEATGMGVSAAGEGLTTAQMQQAATFLAAGWDFVDERANGITDAWRMPEGGGYPVLTLGLDGNSPRRLTGEGTAAAPYQIATPDDLGIMWRHDPSACYQLVADIDLAGIRWLGAPITSFSGTFDGGGFVISHLTLDESKMAGLFGCLGQNALVADLGIADANIVGGDDAHDLGLLAGRSYDGYYGSDIVRCYATGRLSAGRYSFALGGLVGRNYSIVTDCYTKVDLSCGEKSGCLGGLLGYNHGAALHSYAAGTVVTPDPNATCGSLAGTTVGTLTVNNCYFLATADGGGPNNGLGLPLTDTRMKQQASFAFWDFKNTWTICAGKDYPRLRWENVDCDQP
jgi:hypothetical protein